MDNSYIATSRSASGFFGAALFTFSTNFRSLHGPLFGIFVNTGYAYSNPQPVLDNYGRTGFILMLGIRFGGSW